MTDETPEMLSTPKLGDPVSFAVVPSSMRMTLFPDNFTVASVGPKLLELVWLRQGFVLVAQHGVIIESDEGGLSINIVQNDQATQVEDLGHVRLTLEKGLDLAVGLINHAIQHHGVDGDDIASKIARAPEDAT